MKFTRIHDCIFRAVWCECKSRAPNSLVPITCFWRDASYSMVGISERTVIENKMKCTCLMCDVRAIQQQKYFKFTLTHLSIFCFALTIKLKKQTKKKCIKIETRKLFRINLEFEHRNRERKTKDVNLTMKWVMWIFALHASTHFTMMLLSPSHLFRYIFYAFLLSYLLCLGQGYVSCTIVHIASMVNTFLMRTLRVAGIVYLFTVWRARIKQIHFSLASFE